jgi:hypothetical protein
MIVKVDVLQEDIDKSLAVFTSRREGDFSLCVSSNCVLSTAFKRIFDVERVSATRTYVRFNDEKINLPEEATELVQIFDKYIGLKHPQRFVTPSPQPTSLK